MRLFTLLFAAVLVGCDGNSDPKDDTSVDTDSPADIDGDGYSTDNGDCDDGDASVYPGADEVWYDGVDQDCDGLNDYDQDFDGYDQGEDCDDENGEVNPDAVEQCNGIDDNCDGQVDESGDLAVYLDEDGDGYGAGEPVGTYCEPPAGTASNADDCVDTDPAINPAAAELCDGVDQDCDGVVDDDPTDGHTVYTDGDGDGYGDSATGVAVCGDVEDTVEDGTDCDDADVLTFPGAEELCDLKDNNCDGTVDEGATETRAYYADADGDGYGDPAVTVDACGAPAGYVEAGADCDDTNAELSPGADEVCDGIDNNCDGGVDTDAVDGTAYYTDGDGDGYGDEASIVVACDVIDGAVTDGGDCDDTSAEISPEADELCDGVDNNCDDAVDESTALDASTWYLDADADGYGEPSGAATACDQPDGFAASSDDCDDVDAAINPGAVELCDGLDQDCDGLVDNDAADGAAYYTDADADGYGDVSTEVYACEELAGYVTDGSDCDDTDAATFPGAEEVCDGQDQDCDGQIDDDATDGATVYLDSDGDGFGDSVITELACTVDEGWADSDTDCDDGDASVNPGAAEVCDGLDNNCDGAADEAGADGESTWYLDADGDGFGISSSTADACDEPSGYAAVDGDCDDGDSASNPAETELDDGVDNDCDGEVDEGFTTSGDVIITEVTRQPRFGASATNTNGQWFELYNTTATDIDLSGWYVQRVSSTLAADAFTIDPSAGMTIAAGGYATLCKTDNFVSSSSSYSTMPACDYYWGDETEASSYTGTYADNTFNLQRDEDTLSIYAGGSSGTLMDEVSWTYDATDGYWPRDATRSMSLDPAAFDDVSNDDLTSWCSTAATSTYAWYTRGTSTTTEYGTPAADNYDCP